MGRQAKRLATDKMNQTRYDAIIIGAGHNGLTTACFMAKAGLKVLVLEKNDYLGGAAVSLELHPGWTYSNCSYVCSLLRPEIVRDLDLPKYGLQVIPYSGGGVFMQNGDHLCNYTDHDAHRLELARHSKKDSEAYDRYSTDLMRQCRFIKPLLMRMAPDPTSFKPRDLAELAYLGKRFHDFSEAQMAETLRFWTMSVAEFLDEYFESDVIKAYYAGSGIIGTALGPMSPGTAYVLLHHYMGEVDGNIGAWGFARGGMGSISKAMAACFEDHGGEIRSGCGVDKVLVKNGRTIGVVLKNGDDYYANTVISNADVKHTFLDIVERNDLPEDFVRQVERFKIRGSSGKLNIALDGMPEFPQVPKDSPIFNGDMHFTDSIERMERGYDDWKNGTWSKDPYLDMLLPTRIDPTMAPPGKHYMTVFVQYAPYHLANNESWDGPNRDAFAQTVFNQISEYSPNFKDMILHYECRTPLDIEREAGITEGNIFQGELTFDQLLFNRPVPGYAQYRSPIKGLYMCGSSTHPGGGVMGAPGANAAREVLRDLGARQTVRGY
ncbi:NAD(P)/FAD-dependent oxidoreductase [Kiloniella laminariae]|uniref:Pyridine nucleotide-disulfide oxidoreductase domain-containing protein 2 n=1 Tax=Kiloniella laminariae TaxID=454162 RepID=A0ABT4LJ14_9PROT|nr:NAD(P)/FAD-dependent oxidoreductase [Kiloniella laminariae]MCZ4281072.1 NAD(P)/FAD-dependent oxidoreductase [Kiloniella laminariae]